MQKITYSKEYMHNLYNGSEEDIHLVLNEFIKEIKSIKQSLASSYSCSDRSLFVETLHKNYAGFAYAGFPQISAQIKNLVEACQQVKSVSEVSTEFNHLLIAIDQCYEISLKEILFLKVPQDYAV